MISPPFFEKKISYETKGIEKAGEIERRRERRCDAIFLTANLRYKPK